MSTSSIEKLFLVLLCDVYDVARVLQIRKPFLPDLTYFRLSGRPYMRGGGEELQPVSPAACKPHTQHSEQLCGRLVVFSLQNSSAVFQDVYHLPIVRGSSLLLSNAYVLALSPIKPPFLSSGGY